MKASVSGTGNNSVRRRDSVAGFDCTTNGRRLVSKSGMSMMLEGRFLLGISVNRSVTICSSLSSGSSPKTTSAIRFAEYSFS